MNSLPASDVKPVNQANTQSDWVWERHIPTDLEVASRVLSQILEKLQQFQWGQRDLFGIHLALEEALVNAMKHGNRMDPGKQVHIWCRISRDEFHIRITDQGTGFNPEDVPDCTAPENLERPCGRGLMLMRNFMSEVAYNEKGNQVTMCKYRSSEEAESA